MCRSPKPQALCHARSRTFTPLRNEARCYSVETEFVALDVLHHEARLVDAIGR